MLNDRELAEATAPLSFAEFLERMKDPAAADLVRSIKNFIKTYNERKPDLERDSQHVQQFLAKSEGAFRQHPVWSTAPAEHQAQAIEGLEKYLMTKIYHKTFATSALDRERDEALTARMTALNFIKPQHLDIPAALQDEKAWQLAMKELHKINSYKAPRDKLVCVLNCCRIINNVLQVSMQQGEARGADDFLPILIYVVIHANPPQLASNLEYIQRFRMQSRMVSESSYFFTQLYSAASFVETINSNSLTIDADEFVARMMAAGVPDMQLLPSTEGSAGLEAKPLPAAEPVRDEPKKAQPTPVNTIAKVEPPKPQRKLKLGSEETKTQSAGLRDANQGGLATSVEELEQAGVALMLEAEANGELQSRHPYIYANAADLRVADVEALLSGYKHLVLRYEALSLALSRRIAPSGGLSPHTPIEPRVYADPPPAVDGPNPFAGSGFSGPATIEAPLGAAVSQPQGFGSLISDLTAPPLLDQQSARNAGQNGGEPASSGTDPDSTPGLGVFVPNTSIMLSLARQLSATQSQETPLSQELLASASLQIPVSPVDSHKASLGAIASTLPPETSTAPGVATAAAAAAIDSATAALAGSNRTSFDASRLQSESLIEARDLSLTPEDSASADELQLENRSERSVSIASSRPRSQTLPSAKTQPALASKLSEVTIPRSYVSSPFGAMPMVQEVELPKPSLPNPFDDAIPDKSAESPASNPEQETPSKALPTALNGVSGSVPLDAPQLPSPFQEQEKSTSFPAAPLDSPFGGEQAEASQEGMPDSELPGSGERPESKVLTGFAHSPFAASAEKIFRDSPSQASSALGDSTRLRSGTPSAPHPFEDSLI